MKFLFGLLLAGAVAVSSVARGQSSIDMLERDLKQMKQEHEEASTKNLDYFMKSLETAEGDPYNAEKLYYSAGGAPPPRAAMMTKYEHETPSEKDARTIVQQAINNSFDTALEMHCAMMRLAVLYVTKPDTAGLDDQLVAWLKAAGQNYPQVGAPVIDKRVSGNLQSGQKPPQAAKIDAASSIKNMAMHDSPIASYLGFHAWNGKDQGNWRLADMPKLYRQHVLDPLRKTPSAATLPAWDTYIAMMNADQADDQRWADIDYPALQFDRDSDDFAIAPNTEKIETLMGIIKAHPQHPSVGDWFKRVQAMLESYRSHQQGQPATQ
jgi:hypothetical protein